LRSYWKFLLTFSCHRPKWNMKINNWKIASAPSKQT
jgi:hypothetical protein